VADGGGVDVPQALSVAPAARKLRADLIEGVERRLCFRFHVWPRQFTAKLMKKRSVRASKQANATGSLRKRKLEPRSYLSPMSTTRTVAWRYGLLGEITALVLWVPVSPRAVNSCAMRGAISPLLSPQLLATKAMTSRHTVSLCYLDPLAPSGYDYSHPVWGL